MLLDYTPALPGLQKTMRSELLQGVSPHALVCVTQVVDGNIQSKVVDGNIQSTDCIFLQY